MISGWLFQKFRTLHTLIRLIRLYLSTKLKEDLSCSFLSFFVPSDFSFLLIEKLLQSFTKFCRNNRIRLYQGTHFFRFFFTIVASAQPKSSTRYVGTLRDTFFTTIIFPHRLPALAHS